MGAPAGPGLQADLVPAPGKLPAERDRRECVARISERGQQDAQELRPAAARTAQAASTSARIIAERPSAVAAIGVTISVPTPASR